MTPEIQAQVFDPFFTTKPMGQGTGLGLSMIHGFVRQSGGRLEIETAPGTGTTVRMIFPVRRDAEVEPAREQQQEEQRLDDTLGPAHILVVEDNDEVLALAREILESQGYKVSTAVTGEDGLRLFDELHPKTRIDLLFTDLVMPGGMNGLMLGDAIISRDPSVSILMTTGYNEELVVNGPRARASDVLSKPYRHAELLDRVRQALNRRGETGDRRRRSDFGAAQA
jgi:CheY-like chemotaxis protein